MDEVEGIDETFDSLSDEMRCENEEETCSGWRVGTVIFSLSKPRKESNAFSSKMRKYFSH